jgi:FKBP-type peptidyl-prolyl cis-trans isomerase FklB
MKRIVFLASAALLAGALISCTASTEEGNAPMTQLDTFAEKSGYAIGMDVANSLAQIKDDVDHTALLQGLGDALGGGELLLTEEEARQVMQEFTQNVQARQAEERSANGAKNLTEGQAFLEANRHKVGVEVTESGLQYKVVREGEGPSPTAEDRVTVHYRGTLIDGTEFDSSYKRGEPATFAVGGVIRGWSEALQLMKPGGKYELYIPPELGYGERGAGQQIGPNAVLVFEVELLEIAE